jgi:hypothetical protein
MSTTNKPELLTVHAELTDTYGGEANYGWVRRATFTVPASTSDRAIVRRAKKALQITGHPCHTSNVGDMIQLDPRNWCARAFITWETA